MANYSYSIEMKKISEFEGFNPAEFCVSPWKWRYESELYVDCRVQMEEARKLAESVDGICIAIVHSITGDFVIANTSERPFAWKFMLFNAAVCGECSEKTAVRAVTPNSWPLNKKYPYAYDVWVKFTPGSAI